MIKQTNCHLFYLCCLDNLCLIVFLAVLLILVSCTPSPSDSLEATVQAALPTPTLEPTFTPAPRPTNTPHASPTAVGAELMTPTATPKTNLSDTIVGRDNSATELISIASDGTEGKSGGYYVEPPWRPGPSISTDGRYVAFSSWAKNLVSDDTNEGEDVFVRDRQTGQTIRVSVASEGAGGGNFPSISADGRYVAFSSTASDLVSDDSNNDCNKNGYPGGSLAGIATHCADVFVYDQQTDQINRISLASNGTQGNGASSSPSLSADGRYVAYWSKANNLVEGDTNDTDDVFVHDRQIGQTSRVSVASDGSQGNGFDQRSFAPWAGPPSISADGRYVAYWSDATNLVDSDTNGKDDVFVHDQQTGQTSRVSITSDGTQGNGRSGWPSISADGRYVAFTSEADNLVSNDSNGTWDIFVHDRQTGQTSRASMASDGTQGNGRSDYPSISADGRYIAFSSEASNLISNDNNRTWDVFIHDRQTRQTNRVSNASDDSPGNSSSFSPSLSADGRYIAFWSNASNLVSDDTNDEADIFVHDRGNRPNENLAAGPVEEARDGKIAFMFKQDLNDSWDIYVMNPNGSNLTRLTDTPANELHPTWSPDGQQLAFISEQDDSREIYVMNADGSGLTQLGAYAVVNGPLTWSPDSQQIAFVAEQDGKSEINLINADGSGLKRFADGSSPSWSPDGRQIAFATSRDTDAEVYVMNVDGSNQRHLIDPAGDPTWSPLGDYIAVSSYYNAPPPQLYLVSADASNLLRLVEGGSPTWSPDGQWIIFISSARGGDGPSFSMVNADGSGLTFLTTSPLLWPSRPIFSPDSRQVAFVSEREGFGIDVMNVEENEQRRITNEVGYYGTLDWVREQSQ